MAKKVKNKLPTIKVTYTTNGLTVTADASASSDPDGTIKEYAWTWGDGATRIILAPLPPITTHTYAAAGNYSVKLTLTDNSNGRTKPHTASVTVGNPVTPPPVNPTLIVTPPDSKTVTSSDGSAVTVFYAPATTVGGVGPITIGYSQNSGTSFAVGAHTITVTATCPATGQVSTATFTITVALQTLAVVCPGNQSATSVSGSPVAVTYPAATASGGTAPLVITYTKNSGTNFSVGVTTVTATVTDAHSLTSTCTFTVTVRQQASDQTTWPQITSGSMTYLGAFQVPSGTAGNVPPDEGSASFGLAPAYGMAFDPAGNSGAGSLFISSKENLLNVAEISIPTPIIGAVGSLNVATALQGFADPSNGTLQQANVGNTSETQINRLGGLHVTGSSLIFTGYAAYDADNTQLASHWTRNKNLSSGTAQGPFAFSGSTAGGVAAGYVDGWMGGIPSAWQTALGGTALTGNGAISIISRTSSGPGVFAFTPESLAANFPVQPLVYYPLAHQTLGGGDASAGPSALFKLADQIHGVVFPDGSRSVLFFGYHGTTTNEYGCGIPTNDARVGTNCDLGGGNLCGDLCWYDPDNGSKGSHAYPYEVFVWAYDANDLAAVKSGSKQFYEPVPYATWALTLPYTGVFKIGGAAYDQAHGKLYLAEVGRQQIGCCTFLPIIHVFQVTP